MSKAKRILRAGAMVTLMSMASRGSAAAQNPVAPSLALHLRNDAQVPDVLLAAARAAVVVTFARAGIAATFAETRPNLTIVLLSRHTADKMNANPDAFGFAPGSETARGTIAYVIQPRVDLVAERYSTTRSAVLAAAIAHEVGHMLMFNAHSSTGVMRATWSQEDFRKARLGSLAFDAEQAAQMRAVLTSGGVQQRPTAR